MNNTAAVVVTYNRLDKLKKCLGALLAQEQAACDVLVVDNASTDGTQAWLETQRNPCIHSVFLPTNTGGAGGFCTGMREAALRGYRYVWIMDDDCIPRADALAELLRANALLSGDYGFLSSVALWVDGRECRMNRQKAKKNFYERAELLQHGLLMIEQATFVSCFMRTRTLLRTGLPIREFFIWGDDIEFTRRLAVRMNMPCYLAGKSVVVHEMARNTGSDIATDAAERLGRYHYAYRNEHFLYRQEGLRGMVYYFARCGVHLLRVLAHARDHRLRRCGVILRHMITGFFFRPKIEMIPFKEESICDTII